MTRELDIAAIASIGGWLQRRKRRAEPLPSNCMNCGADLQGPFCHQCGQLAEDYHRSLWRLFEEAFEGLADKDGRFWRTLPRLVLRPAQLTREYLDGKRAGQIPPLRMFLIILLLVFLFGGMGGGGPNKSATVIRTTDGGKATVKVVPKADLEQDLDKTMQIDLGKTPKAHKVSRWFKTRIIAAVHNKKQFGMIVEDWAHRLAILMLPIGAGLLTLLFVFQRRFFVYDHLVFTMHSLSFLGLLLSAMFIIRLFFVRGVADVLLFVPPVHLFMHMRGVYRTSVFGTLVRMALLFVGSFFGFMVLLVTLFLIGLNAMSPA